MRDKFFRHLCAALQLRAGRGTERDGRLYEDLKARLGMKKLTPKQFFAAHPQLNETEVFEAFADVMEPFAQMVEQVFQVCRGGTPGQEFKIRHEERADSLRFDAEAFKRFRAARQAVRWRGTVAKYHNNFVPLYAMRLQEMAAPFSEPPAEPEVIQPEGVGEPEQVAEPALIAVPEPVDEDFDELLTRAEMVGRTHLDLLDDINRQLTEAPEEGLLFEQWLGTLGVSGFYLPHSRTGLERWRESMQSGLAAVERIRSSARPRRLPEEKRKETLQELKALCGALVGEQEIGTWRDAVDKWLELPYWRKRWQVYEVWVVSLFLRGAQSTGGVVHVDGRGQIVLRSRKSIEPLAGVRLGEGFGLEVWCDFLIPSEAKIKLRPDIVIALQGALGRVPLHFVLCRQGAKEGPGATLKEALSYVSGMPAGSQHLVVRYDDGGAAHKVVMKQGRTVTEVGGVKPGGSGLGVLEGFVGALFEGASDKEIEGQKNGEGGLEENGSLMREA